MLSQDSEDEMRSRFVFVLAIWLWQDELNPRVRCAFGNVFHINSHEKVRYFRNTYDHALALYIAQHHHKILFLLLSCWTRFNWLVLISCCCCSCCGRCRCVVCRCCLRGCYLIQCWHYPAQFKLPLASLTLSMWYVCGILEWFDTLYISSTFTFKFWSAYSKWPCKHGSTSEPIERAAWAVLPVSSCPIVVHWFEGSGWYSSTWQAKMISSLSSSYCKPTSSTIQGNFQIITLDLVEEEP